MEQYITFVERHPLLVMGFLAILGMIIYIEFNLLTRKFNSQDPKKLVTVMNKDGALLLDVRDAKEQKHGVISGAKHIPFADIPKRMAELEKYKSSPVVVYCQSGTRSGHVCGQLVKAGFADVYSMSGGFSAWQGENLPVVHA